MQHRSDIAGLRAVAIVPVVLFHLGVPGVGGGFVGVDVFFVISGFLITRLIHDQAVAGRFSLAEFYERRARRILPALFAMLAVSAAVGLMLLSPQNLERLGRELIATPLFLSNALFANETRYFDPTLASRVLLHTWSLSIEEQFYLLFPGLVVLLAKRPRALVLAIAVVGALSLFAAVSGAGSRAAFFATGNRAYELAIGALVAVGRLPAWPSRRWADGASLAGLLLIVSAILGFSGDTPFPGAWALVPCVGTALILHAGRDGPSAAGRLLSLPVFTGIGLISYSLYIWHWPLIAFYRYLFLTEPDLIAGVALAGFAVGLAFLSYRFVEQPLRRPRPGGRRRILVISIVAVAGLAGLGATLSLTHGLPGRFDPEAVPHGAEDGREHVCFITDEEPQTWRAEACGASRSSAQLWLWGDSYAAHLDAGLAALPRSVPTAVVEAAYSSCPPLLGARRRDRPACPRFTARVLDAVARYRPRVVILAAHWRNYDQARTLDSELRATIRRLRELGVGQVVVVGEFPDYVVDAPQMAIVQKALRKTPTFEPRTRFLADPVLSRVTAEEGALFFRPYDLFCAGRLCRFADAEGRLLVWDNGHLSVRGSRLVAEALAPTLRRALSDGVQQGPDRRPAAAVDR